MAVDTPGRMSLTPYRDASVRLRQDIEELRRDRDWALDEIARLGSFQTRPSKLVERVLGGPLRFESTHDVAGRLSDNRIDHAMGVLAAIYDESGTNTTVGRRFVWMLPRTQHDQRNVEVTLVERNGSVRVCGRQKFTDMAMVAGSLALVAGLLVAAVIATLSRCGVAVVPVVVAVVLWLVSIRTVYARATRRHARRLVAATDMIAEALRRNPTGASEERTAAVQHDVGRLRGSMRSATRA